MSDNKHKPTVLYDPAIRDVLKRAYDARDPVTVALKDGSEQSGLLDEFRDNYRGDRGQPHTGEWTFEIRFHGESTMISGAAIKSANTSDA